MKGKDLASAEQEKKIYQMQIHFFMFTLKCLREPGTFWTRDEHALASNFIPQTHRIQRWSVLTDMVPDISDCKQTFMSR